MLAYHGTGRIFNKFEFTGETRTTNMTEIDYQSMCFTTDINEATWYANNQYNDEAVNDDNWVPVIYTVDIDTSNSISFEASKTQYMYDNPVNYFDRHVSNILTQADDVDVIIVKGVNDYTGNDLYVVLNPNIIIIKEVVTL